MDVVVIFNGLGNQMSQYAFYLAKKRINKNCYCIFDPKSVNEHNGSELDRIFGVKYKSTLIEILLTYIYVLRRKKYIGRILGYLGVRIIREAKNYDYNPILKEKGKYGLNYYWGGWHSEKNFEEIKQTVCDTFKFPTIKDDDEFLYWLETINSDFNSVSIHIRRGDYLNIKKTDFYQFDNVATLDYYKRAIDYIKTRIDKPTFYIFSNDIEWVRKNFCDENIKIIDCNVKENSWRDMYLMSLCHHHINANSTFSWWGAWLCQYHDAIIMCPYKFIRTIETKDIYPNNWIKI